MSQAGRYTTSGGGGGSIMTLTGNIGAPVPPTAGNIDIFGLNVLNVVGNPGISTLTINLINGTNGQLLIGGGVEPLWADITSLGNTISITQGANSLNLETGDSVAVDYVADAGSAIPAAQTLNILGGAGITTTGAGNTITITASGAAFTWVEVTTPAQAMATETGYIANDAGLVTLLLPAVAVVGDEVEVTGKGAGGWLIAQNGGQTIFFGAATTTPGPGGSLASTQQRDSVRLVCVTTNNDWNVLSSIGNLAVV